MDAPICFLHIAHAAQFQLPSAFLTIRAYSFRLAGAIMLRALAFSTWTAYLAPTGMGTMTVEVLMTVVHCNPTTIPTNRIFFAMLFSFLPEEFSGLVGIFHGAVRAAAQPAAPET